MGARYHRHHQHTPVELTMFVSFKFFLARFSRDVILLSMNRFLVRRLSLSATRAVRSDAVIGIINRKRKSTTWSDIRTGIVHTTYEDPFPSELVRTSHVFRHALPSTWDPSTEKRNPPAEVSVVGGSAEGEKLSEKQDKNSSPTILVHTDILSHSITDLLDSILSPVTYTSTQRSFLPPTPPPHHTALVCWCPICHMPYQISKDARKKECDFFQFQKSMPDRFYLMRFAGKSMPNEFQTGDDVGAGGKGISSVGFCVHGWGGWEG